MTAQICYEEGRYQRMFQNEEDNAHKTSTLYKELQAPKEGEQQK